MNPSGAAEADRSVVRLRTAGVAIALAIVGLLSLGSAWCGRERDRADTPRPLLMEPPQRQATPAPPAPPARP